MMDIEVRLAALEVMPLTQLRAEWRQEFKTDPPALRSPELLRRMIAWSLQAEAFGDLSPRLRRQIVSSAAPISRGPTLTPGTRISREWRGRVCDVEVVSDGFVYEGRRFATLSEIARYITGVRWNGPRFFGLRGKTA